MRTTRTLIALCCGLLLGTASLAQDAKPEPKLDPAIELQKLLKTPGANWSYRIVKWDRETGAESSTENWSVTKVVDGLATIEHRGSNKSGSSSWSGSGTEVIDPKGPDAKTHWAMDNLPAETLDLGFGKFPCRKHAEKTNGQQVATWVSTQYHPLVVKRVVLSPDHAETKTLTSFSTSEVDPWLLYRMKGRSWTLKTTTAGAEPVVSYTRTTVKDFTETGATLTYEFLDADKKPMQGTEPVDSQFTFETFQAKPVAGPVRQPEPKEESKRVEAGEFACLLMENNGVKVWSSRVWPSLTVAYEVSGSTAELVEFDLGHDQGAFYRTAGNSYTLRSDIDLGAMKVVSQTKQAVKSVADGKATVAQTIVDGNGRQTGTNEFKMDVTEASSPRLAYTDQVEELIRTPAGVFAAIRTEPGQGLKMWMWNGLVVRQEMKNEGMTMIVELTELTLK